MAEIITHHGLLKDVKLHVDDYGGTGRPLSGASWAPQIPVVQQHGYRPITYDRRGFGRSDKPLTGYGYDSLAEDLHKILNELDVPDATLVGFSMGGGEVARYLATYGPERVRSAVFAAAVTPYMMRTPDNPEGPLQPSEAARMTAALTANQDKFYDGFVTEFFSAGGQLQVSEQQRQEALALTGQAGKVPALECMAAFGNTDFREDLTQASVPTLVLHGDGDATVPFEGSGMRTHAAIPGSDLAVLPGAPHGCNVSHADAFNAALLKFLRR
ncbi:alpha/beta fold hydrolase [Dactylosporangium sp. CS-033363]|uniref:alpha/beta fold hydrolase n=1 Tax=Dactylosporangium sp. CS-033363 TaxID=3239935 RepID=UPI003D8E838A